MYEFLDMDNSLDITFWSLFLLAFFMMSRKSNLVPTSVSKFDKNKQLCRGDIVVEQDILIILVKWSKTIQFGQRMLRIPIASIPGNILCPVAAYKNMIRCVPARSNSPAFCKVVHGKLVPIIYLEFQKKIEILN